MVRRPRGRRGHNVTPREDYRTALLSDSPDTGCSLSILAAGTANRSGWSVFDGTPRTLAAGRFSGAITVGGSEPAQERERGTGRPSGRRSRGTNQTQQPRQANLRMQGKEQQQEKHPLSGPVRQLGCAGIH
jgi:hypothetical protein